MSFKSYTDKEFLIRVKADINQALGDLKKLPSEIGKTAKESKKAGEGLNSMGKGMQFLTRAALAYVSVRTAISIVKQADAFNVLNVRIKTATRETGDYNEVQRQLYDINKKNGTAYEATVSLFQSLARSAPELKATNAEMLTLTNLVGQLGVISGTSKAAQRAGMLQFSQGLSAGVFRAEEFNSLLENMPELAKRIAKGLGQTSGELRKAVIEGKVLSKDVFDSLITQADDINQQFKEIPAAVERSGTKMGTSFSRMLSILDKASGVTKLIAQAFDRASDNMDYISDRLSEDELAKVMRMRKEAGDNYTKAINDGFDKSSQKVQVLLKWIDTLDAKIKQLNIKKISEADKKKEESGSVEKIEVNEDQKSIDKLIESLKRQHDEFGLSKEAIALYRLELMGASPAEIELASAIVATTKAKRDHDEVMKEGKRIYEETRTDAEKLSNEIARLNKLYQDGAFGAVGSAEAFDALSRAVFDATEQFEDLEEEGVNSFAALEAATRGWGDEFTNTLADMVQQGKLDFSSLVDSIISDLLRIAIYQSITAPIFGSLGIPGFDASVHHSGGFAGTGPTRTVNPFVFAGAQRFHSGGFPGLRADEVPAILQKGELVLSKDQVAGAAGGSAGGSLRVELINKGAPAKATEVNSSADINGQVISIVIDDIDRGGPLRSRIQEVSNS